MVVMGQTTLKAGQRARRENRSVDRKIEKLSTGSTTNGLFAKKKSKNLLGLIGRASYYWRRLQSFDGGSADALRSRLQEHGTGRK